MHNVCNVCVVCVKWEIGPCQLIIFWSAVDTAIQAKINNIFTFTSPATNPVRYFSTLLGWLGGSYSPVSTVGTQIEVPVFVPVQVQVPLICIPTVDTGLYLPTNPVRY